MKKLLKNVSVLLFAAFLTVAAGSVAQAVHGSCTYKGEIYYSIYNKLYKLNPSTKKTKLIKTVPNVWSVDPFAVSGGKVYLTVDSYGGTGGQIYNIYSMDLKTKKMKKLAKGKGGILKGNYIYYIQSKYVKNSADGDKATGIGRVKKNGSGKKKLYSGNVSMYNTFTSNKSRLYFSTWNSKSGSRVKSITMKGKSVKTEAGDSSWSLLGTDHNYLYYTKDNYPNANSVYRQKIGSSKKTLVASGFESAAVYDNALYYVKRLSDDFYGKTAVYKKDLKSGKTKKIYTGNGIRYIASCGRWLILTRYMRMTSATTSNTQNIVITTSGKKVKNLQKYFVS